MIELRHVSTSGRLPTSEFNLFVDGRDVGYIQVRHRPSHGAHMPEGSETHIASYGVEPSARRKGYGTAILRLALVEARKIGLTEVLVGAGEENVAAWRIAEKSGGELLTVFHRLDNGEASRHYRINLK